MEEKLNMMHLIVDVLAAKLGEKRDVKKYSNVTLQFPVKYGTFRLEVEEDDTQDNYRMYRYFRPDGKRKFIQVGLYSLHYFTYDMTADDVAECMRSAAEVAIGAVERAYEEASKVTAKHSGLVLDIIQGK